MINISDKPHKKTEHFSGVIFMAIAGHDRIEWKFELLRHTNGAERFEVYVEDADEFAASMIKNTILANIQREQVSWKPL